MTKVTRGWPPSRRAAQAAALRRRQPWLKSTGPRTAAGKAICARNAYKHGFRTPAASQIRALLRWHNRCVKSILHNQPLPPSPSIPLPHGEREAHRPPSSLSPTRGEG